MTKQLNVSMCLTDLMEKAKLGHSAFSRGKNGKVYINMIQWMNEEADQYGNISSFQLNSKKELREQEGKTYVGNAKEVVQKLPEAIQAGGIEVVDDLPF